MHFLVVEDNKTKALVAQFNIEKRYNADCSVCKSYNEAVRYLLKHKTKISGIILDMDFPVSENVSASHKLGVEFLNSMVQRGINIPVLINSMETVYPNELTPFVFKQEWDASKWQDFMEFCTV